MARSHFKIEDESQVSSLFGTEVLNGKMSIKKFAALHILDFISKIRDRKKFNIISHDQVYSYINENYDAILDKIATYNFEYLCHGEEDVSFLPDETIDIRWPLTSENEVTGYRHMYFSTGGDINNPASLAIMFYDTKGTDDRGRINEAFYYHHDNRLSSEDDLIARAYYDTLLKIIDIKKNKA